MLCEEAAKFYIELKNKGTMVGEFDILIAAITRANNEEFVTRDEHFELLIDETKLQNGKVQNIAKYYRFSIHLD
jgi:predicted nucleic acid-binding protein